MIKIEFTSEEEEALNYERFHHPHPRVQRKMEALWLKSQGVAHHQIAKLTKISKNTLTTYLRDYKEGGIEKLKELNFYRPQSELVQHKQTIEADFLVHPPATIKEAMSRIEKLTGIKRSEPQVRQFLKSIGIKRYKVGIVPAKADIEQQQTFKKKSYNPVSTKPEMVRESSFLSMPPTLYSHPF